MAAYYSGVLDRQGKTLEVQTQIGSEALLLQGETGTAQIDYADIRDMRLLNYHLLLELPNERVSLSRLGRETENFFEQLWCAYNARCAQSLFLQGTPLIEAEGAYTYTEGGGSARGKAKLLLYPDCVCLLPHDDGARRIALCFAEEPVIDGYTLRLQLDTGEQYELMQLGHDTEGFHMRLRTAWEQTQHAWRDGHRRLEQDFSARLGEAKPQFDELTALCNAQNVYFGLFSPDNPDFWVAGLKNGRAAVELVSGEKTATYLYRTAQTAAQFMPALRHAMETVNLHRELIYLPQAELEQKPLYRMAVSRSAHVRYLRENLCGRVIHTAQWAQRLQEALEV